MDVEDVYLDGLERWGREKAAAYDAALHRAISRLRTFPRLGRVRSDLPREYRTIVVEAHVVVYEVVTLDERDVAVRIARVLHQSRDAASHFRE